MEICVDNYIVPQSLVLGASLLVPASAALPRPHAGLRPAHRRQFSLLPGLGHILHPVPLLGPRPRHHPARCRTGQ